MIWKYTVKNQIKAQLTFGVCFSQWLMIFTIYVYVCVLYNWFLSSLRHLIKQKEGTIERCKTEEEEECEIGSDGETENRDWNEELEIVHGEQEHPWGEWEVEEEGFASSWGKQGSVFSASQQAFSTKTSSEINRHLK